MVEQLAGTVFGRWYVTIFGLSFAVLAVRHLGWKRTAIYTGVALAVGVVAENGSVRYGIPYTRYSFNPDLRGHEIFVGDVPLMVSLSYTFMSYFAFAAARLLVAGPRRTRSDWPAMELAVAVMLAVWALWIVDPVSRLGAHFFLGELFRYDGPGFWFGLPLGSQLGFTCTSGILVGVLTWLARDEGHDDVAALRAHPRLPALLAYCGQVLFMTVTAFAVARTTSDPAVAASADALAGATFVIAVPFAMMTAVAWRSQRQRDRATPPVPVPRDVRQPDPTGAHR